LDAIFLIAALIGGVSLLYATAGQAGGTAFLAVMAVTGFAGDEMRPTALALNIVAAGYATWRLHHSGAIDWTLLRRLTLPSLVTAFVGGIVVLEGRTYFIVTGLLLIAAALLVMRKRDTGDGAERLVPTWQAVLAGGSAGLLSGLSGVGGGVFLAPQLVAFGWTSPKRAAALSPPFILCNSIVGLAAVLIAGQRLAPGTAVYAVGALTGAILGTAIGLRWMSDRVTRYAMAAILAFAGIRLLLR
jgi:hypothetical protein